MSLQPSEFHVERLESRLFLAGNVEANVRGGTLFVDGDHLGNRITISAAGTTVNIEGLEGTNVNGLPMDDFIGVTRNIVIRMRDGFDQVTMENLNVGGFLSVNAGPGRARLILGDSRVSGDVRIATGTVATDAGGYCIVQSLYRNVIGGRLSIRNSAVDAVESEWGISTFIQTNELGRGVQVRQQGAELTNLSSESVIGGTGTTISSNTILSGGVRIATGNSSVSVSARIASANRVRVFNNTTVTGGVFVRLGSAETSNTLNGGFANGNYVSVSDNLSIDGNINIRVGNATVTGNETGAVHGNQTLVTNNGDITGNVIVRQGSATAVGSAEAMTGNEFLLENNSVAGQVNVFNGDASVVSEGFAYALGIHNSIEGNELDRLRVNNRSGSSSSAGFAAGINSVFRDNRVSRDVFISDGNATGSVADALLSISSSFIDGRLNYVGRNGSNELTLDSTEVVGRVLARAGNGDDSFRLIGSTFEGSVRLDGVGGEADAFFDHGGNTYQAGPPVLVGIEIGT